MNKFVITGNVTHDPKKILYKKTPESYMVKLGVAVHDRGSSFFVDLKIFRPELVEQVSTYITKGRFVEVDGHFEAYKESLDFIADDIIFGERDKKEKTYSEDNF